jgi:hypothetical protein
MTLKEQLLQEIEQAPESLLEALLRFCQELKAQQSILKQPGGAESASVVAQKEAVKRLQAKMRETIPRERSLVDELIAERRMEAESE